MSTVPNAGPAESTSDTATGAPDCAALQAELESERQRSLRLAADFDNFRKRTARDSEQRATAQKDALIRDLLPVVDNLERALASHASTSAAQLRTGIEMTFQQLLDVFRRHGVKPEESLGESFDAHRHEAINARFDPGQPDHAVLEVVQRGYRRGDEIIRPAKVIINDLSLTEDEDHGS
jgi:molecular chaperone GrpE